MIKKLKNSFWFLALQLIRIIERCVRRIHLTVGDLGDALHKKVVWKRTHFFGEKSVWRD